MSERALPGGDIVAEGLRDLEAGRDSTVPALLVSIAAPRLRAMGMTIPNSVVRPEHRLYALLARSDSNAAHSRYNALVRRLVSFERALTCVG